MIAPVLEMTGTRPRAGVSATWPFWAVVVLVLAGCSSTRHCGDATFTKTANFPFVSPDPLKFPIFSIGKVGSHYWSAKDLPFAIYPTQLYISPLHQGTDVPWKSLVLRVAVSDEHGKVISENLVKMRKFEAGVGIWCPFPDLGLNWEKLRQANLRSYEVRVEVFEPSEAPDDAAFVGSQASWWKLPTPN